MRVFDSAHLPDLTSAYCHPSGAYLPDLNGAYFHPSGLTSISRGNCLIRTDEVSRWILSCSIPIIRDHCNIHIPVVCFGDFQKEKVGQGTHLSQRELPGLSITCHPMLPKQATEHLAKTVFCKDKLLV